MQPKECWGSRGQGARRDERKEERRKRSEEEKRNREDEKKKRKSSRKLKENQLAGEEVGLGRTDTYSKAERLRAAAQLALQREEAAREGRRRTSSFTKEPGGGKEPAKMTTSFKEVVDRKLRQETSSVLSRSGPNSPMSWYIPSDPPSRAASKLSSSSRQNSQEGPVPTPSPPATTTRGDQTYRPSGSETYRPGPRLPQHQALGRHFGHQYPSRQVGSFPSSCCHPSPRPVRAPLPLRAVAKVCRPAARCSGCISRRSVSIILELVHMKLSPMC